MTKIVPKWAKITVNWGAQPENWQKWPKVGQGDGKWLKQGPSRGQSGGAWDKPSGDVPHGS